jgi:hypothetical protein
MIIRGCKAGDLGRAYSEAMRPYDHLLGVWDGDTRGHDPDKLSEWLAIVKALPEAVALNAYFTGERRDALRCLGLGYWLELDNWAYIVTNGVDGFEIMARTASYLWTLGIEAIDTTGRA